jgi:hypothetical protein
VGGGEGGFERCGDIGPCVIRCLWDTSITLRDTASVGTPNVMCC